MTAQEWTEIQERNRGVGVFNVFDLDFRPQGDLVPEGDLYDGDKPVVVDNRKGFPK